MRRLIVAFALLTVSGCAPFPIHTDCIGSSGCGYQTVPAAPQDLTVTGADEADFGDGRGRCFTSASTMGYNDQVRHVRVFLLDLWVPATAPRYKIQVRINGYQGPGRVSSADNERLRGDPGNGGIVSGDAYLVPSPERLATANTVAFTIDSGEISGSLRLEFPDRTIAGSWHCTSGAGKTN